MAAGLATTASSALFTVPAAELLNMTEEVAAQLVRTMFTRAREAAPALVVVDDVDALCTAPPDRAAGAAARAIKAELLVQLDAGGPAVLATTRAPWELDLPLRRRMEKRIYLPMPDAAARNAMLRTHLADMPHGLASEDFTTVAALTEGYAAVAVARVPARQCCNFCPRRSSSPPSPQVQRRRHCQPGAGGAPRASAQVSRGQVLCARARLHLAVYARHG